MPTGYVSPDNFSRLNLAASGANVEALRQAINQRNMQAAMVGSQNFLPEFTGSTDQDVRQYVQMLAASDPQTAEQFASFTGSSIPDLMQEAEAAGYYRRAPTKGLLGKAMDVVGGIGRFAEDNPALMFALPFAVGAATGAFGGAGAGAGGAGAAGGSATTFPLATGGPVTVSAIPGVTAGTTAATTAATTAGAATAARAAGSVAGAAASGGLQSFIPAIIGGGLSLIGADQASDAAEDAVNAQTQASREALDFQRESRDIALGILRPETESANVALARMLQMTGQPIPTALQNALTEAGVTDLPEFDITKMPGYEFEVNEGLKRLENTAFARGGGMNGGFGLKALRYAQDYASTKYGEIYNQLASIAGKSQSTNEATTALNFGTGAARTALNSGDARASGYVAQGNAWQNALDQIAELPWDQWFPQRKNEALSYGV